MDTWFGVTVSAGRVTELNLPTNNLIGTLSNALGDLSALERLDLSSNQFSGGIPASLGNLGQLFWLNLRSSGLTGSIPAELGGLQNLGYLLLSGNELSGSVPLELGNMSSLIQFEVSSNNLSGEIPEAIGLLPNLLFIQLASNSFTGSLPISFSSAIQLQVLFIRENDFESLPDLTSLTNITYFDISDNRVAFGDLEINQSVITDNTGQKDFGPPQNFFLNAGDNLTLNSFIPSVSPNDTYQWQKDGQDIDGANDTTYTITNIGSLDIGEYQLLVTNSSFPGLTIKSRQISVDVFEPVLEADSLALVDFYNELNGGGWTDNTNWLAGPVNSWFGVSVDQGRVVGLELSENQLTGAIPPELGNLTNLQSLVLYNNQLTGNIPPELGNLTNLQLLYLYNNQLTGSIPPELGNLTNLTVLHLAANQLSDPIPPELGNLTNLTSLGLSNNQLIGSIPPELGNLTNLTDLQLFNNRLTGSIPVELGNLTNLTSLGLSTNQLNGSIPQELGNLTNLREMILVENLFTSFLSDLSNMTALEQIWLYDNDLAEIDPAIQLPPSVTEFYIDNNALTSVPDLPIQTYRIAGNRIPFSALVNLSGNAVPGPQSFRYELTVSNQTPATGGSVTLTTASDDPNNLFQWYKENDPIAGATDATLELTSLSAEDEGAYYCVLTNSLVPDVEISSEIFVLELDITSREYAFAIAEVSSSERINSEQPEEILGVSNSIGGDRRGWRPSLDDPNPSIVVEFENATNFNTVWASIPNSGGFVLNTSYSVDGITFTEFDLPFSQPTGPGGYQYRWDFETIEEEVKFLKIELDSSEVANNDLSIDAIAIGINNFSINRPQELALRQLISESIINIGWAGGGAGDGVIIERAINSGTYQVIDSILAVENQFPFNYSDRSVPAGDSVFYRVRSFEGANFSGYSNELFISRCETFVATNNTWSGDADPNPFTGITTPQPDIIITENSGSSYQISDISGGWTDFTGLGFEYYPIRANINFDCNGEITVDFLNAPGVGCGGDTNLKLDSAFYFPQNDSLLFYLDWPTCGVSFKSWFNLNPGDRQPELQAAVTDLDISQPNLNSIEIVWRDDNPDETAFIIERSVGNDSTFVFLDSASAVENDPNINQLYIGQYIDTDNIIANEIYYYRVITRNEAGDSPPSSVVSITAASTTNFERLLSDPATTDLSNATYSGYWGDYDNDGDADLYVQNWQKGPDPVFIAPNNYFYENNGDGTFTAIENELTLKGVESRAGSWGDLDNDGDLDLVIKITQNEINVLGAPLVLYENLGNGSFNEINLSNNFSTGGFDHVLLADFDNDGLLDILSNNYIFYNSGELSFEQADYQTTFPGKASNSTPYVHTVDIDLDDDLDVYFGGDVGSKLYINNSDRTFTLSDQLTNDSLQHRGGTWGDFDNDGDFDFFMVREFEPVRDLFRYFRNDNGVFQQFGPADLGIDSVIMQRGATVLDYNNDGLLDIVGNIYSSTFQNGIPIIIHNNGDQSFNLLSDSSFAEVNTFVSGMSVADINGDGYQDFFIASGFSSNQSNYIYINSGPDNLSNNYLKVVLDGSRSNRNGIGARIRVVANGAPTQVKQVNTMNGTWAGNEITANFGLSTAARVDSIEVFWPLGQYTLVTDTVVNQLITIMEYSAPSMQDQLFSLLENSTEGTVIDTIEVSDPDGDTLRYEITAGNTDNVFALDSLTGIVTLLDSSAIDFESTQQFTFDVAVSDPDSTVSAVITIDIIDINEIQSANDTIFYIDQSASNGTIIGSIPVEDPEMAEFAFQIDSGDPDGIFSVDSLGQVNLVQTSLLDYDIQPEYDLVVSISDTLFSINLSVLIKITSLSRDRLALIDFQDATGSSFTNWGGATLDETWQGVSISNGRVSQLNLPDLGITGNVPETFQDLTGLQEIDLSGNDLTSFPDVSFFPVISTLNLSGNRLGFTDLIPNIGISDFQYSNQQSFLLQSGDTIQAGTTFFLGENYDEKYIAPSNTYRWIFKQFESEILDEVLTSDSSGVYSIDSLNFDQMGEYYVLIENSTLSLNIESEPFTILAEDDIFGTVFADNQGTLLTEGSVEIFKVQPAGTPYDSTASANLTSEGQYLLENIILGDYILKIEPSGSFTERVIQTYYVSQSSWEDADTLLLREKTEGIDIFALFNPGNSPGEGDPTATASAIGILEEEFEEGAAGNRIEARRKVRKAGCSLRRRIGGGGGGRVGYIHQDFDPSEFNELIAYVETNENGEFSFTNLPADVYLLNIQYPGVPMDENSNLFLEVPEDREGTEFQINALVTEEGIQVEINVVLGIRIPYLQDLAIYPNPTDGRFSISYLIKRKTRDLTAEIFDMQGKSMLMQSLPVQLGGQRVDLDIQNFSPGMYQLVISGESDSEIFSYKILKN